MCPAPNTDLHATAGDDRELRPHKHQKHRRDAVLLAAQEPRDAEAGDPQAAAQDGAGVRRALGGDDVESAEGAGASEGEGEEGDQEVAAGEPQGAQGQAHGGGHSVHHEDAHAPLDLCPAFGAGPLGVGCDPGQNNGEDLRRRCRAAPMRPRHADHPALDRSHNPGAPGIFWKN